jgi:MFS family permease
MTTNSLALLRAVYGKDAGRAIGLWTAFTSLVTIGGPAAGGAIVEWTSWRWIFFLNLPLAGIAIAAAELGRCDEQRQLRQGALDLPGAALGAAGVGHLTYGLVQGAEHGFAGVWWSFAGAVAALAAFVAVEQRAEQPMLPFALFRVRNLLVANVATFFIYASLYGVFIYTTLYLQFLGFSPFVAGLLGVPPGVAMVLLAARFGALADRHGPRWFLTGGPVLMGAGALLNAAIGSKSDYWSFGIAGVVCFSLGVAAMVAPITATALKSAPERYAGVASGVNSTVSRLGSLLAVAVIGLAVALVFDARTDVPGATPLARNQTGDEVRAASTDGYRVGMLIGAGLAFAGAAVAGLGISNRDARDEEPAPATERAPATGGNRA